MQQQGALTDRQIPAHVNDVSRAFDVSCRNVIEKYSHGHLPVPQHISYRSTSLQFPHVHVSFDQLPNYVSSYAQMPQNERTSSSSNAHHIAKRFSLMRESTNLTTVHEHAAVRPSANNQRTVALNSSDQLPHDIGRYEASNMTSSLPLVPPLKPKHHLLLTHAPTSSNQPAVMSQLHSTSRLQSVASARKLFRRPWKSLGCGGVSRQQPEEYQQLTNTDTAGEAPGNFVASRRPFVEQKSRQDNTSAVKQAHVTDLLDTQLSSEVKSSQQQKSDGVIIGKTDDVAVTDVVRQTATTIANDTKQTGRRNIPLEQVKTTIRDSTNQWNRLVPTIVEVEKNREPTSVPAKTCFPTEMAGMPLTSRLHTLRCSTPVRQKIECFKRSHELQRVDKLQQARARLGITDRQPPPSHDLLQFVNDRGPLNTTRGKAVIKRLSPTTSWRTWRDINESDVYRDVKQYIADNCLMPFDKEQRIVQWLEQSRRALQKVVDGDNHSSLTDNVTTT